jgi:hypothetical protein
VEPDVWSEPTAALQWREKNMEERESLQVFYEGKFTFLE